MSLDKVVRSIINPVSICFPLAHYSHAVEVNGQLTISGQIGMNKEGVLLDGFQAQVRQVLQNIEKVLEAYGCTFNNVVKTTVLLHDIKTLQEMDVVYAEFFKDHKPARVCYQVAALPRGAFIEIATEAVLGNVVDA